MNAGAAVSQEDILNRGISMSGAEFEVERVNKI